MKLRLIACLPLALIAVELPAGPWQPLFDGKSLDGWTQRGGAAHYAVQNDCIVGTTVSDTPNSFLCTDETYGDFILEYEVLQEGISNSGVQFRSLSYPEYQNGRVHGYQCEIDPSDRGWTAGLYEEGRRGWLSRVDNNPAAKSLYQYGRWNHFRIEAIGSSIRSWLNGVPVGHIIDDQTPEGFIALQVHSIGKNAIPGNRIIWRNIRIQTEALTPSPVDEHLLVRNHIPNHLSAAEAAQGWELLFDGKTSKGWRIAGGDTFPDKGWIIRDGELIIQEAGEDKGQTGGDIVTEKTWSAFELQLDFMVAAGGNSGIKYFLTENPDKPGSLVGLEYQLLDNEGHRDGALGAAGNRRLASLYDLIPPWPVVSGQAVPTKPGQWHHARIVVRPDNSVEHWLDDFKVVSYERGSPLFKALVERSKYGAVEGFATGESTPIALTDHTDEVHFRSIKIRPLD